MIEDRMPWFPCYPSKLLGAMAGMRPDQQLVYVTVLLRIYEVRGPCPDPLDAISRRTGITKRRVNDALESLFGLGKLKRVGTGIINPFSEKVLAKGEATRDERSRAGARGGARSAEIRHKKQSPPPSKAAAKVNHLDLDTEGTLSPNGDRAAKRPEDPEVYLFRRGKEVLGKSAGGLIRNLLASKNGNIESSIRAIEDAATKQDPREYLIKIVKPRPLPSRNGMAALLSNMIQNRETTDEPADHGGAKPAIEDHTLRPERR